jgi:hypothetical protein
MVPPSYRLAFLKSRRSTANMLTGRIPLNFLHS